MQKVKQRPCCVRMAVKVGQAHADLATLARKAAREDQRRNGDPKRFVSRIQEARATLARQQEVQAEHAREHDNEES